MISPGSRVALMRPFDTLGGSSFGAGFELVVTNIYPDQGRLGGDFLTLALPGTDERVLQGVRPAQVRELPAAEETA